MDDPLVRTALDANRQLVAFARWSTLPLARIERGRCTARVSFGDARYGRGVPENRFRQDAGFTLTASLRPIEDLAIRVRIRYLSDDTSDDAYLEESLWLYAEVSYRIRARDWLRVRYDNYAYLDDRDATQTRVPSPEHWLALEYESRF